MVAGRTGVVDDAGSQGGRMGMMQHTPPHEGRPELRPECPAVRGDGDYERGAKEEQA